MLDIFMIFMDLAPFFIGAVLIVWLVARFYKWPKVSSWAVSIAVIFALLWLAGFAYISTIRIT